MARIKVIDICTMAITEDDGLKLRSKMQELLDLDEDVELDFSGINLYATMFFNTCIGYFVIKKGLDYCNEKISICSISKLGMDTFEHSYENAVTISKMKKDEEDIVENNIEGC